MVYNPKKMQLFTKDLLELKKKREDNINENEKV